MNALLEAILTFTNWIWGDSHADSSCRRRVLSCRKTEHAPLSEIAIYSDTHHWKIIHEN